MKFLRYLLFPFLPMGFLPLLIAAVGLAAAGTASSLKAAGKERDAAKAKRKIQEIQNAIQRRDIVQDAFTALTRTKANAAAQGADTSTVGSGGSSSVISQLAFNLAQFDQQSDLQNEAFDKSLDASKWSGIASIFNTASGITSSATGMFGSPSASGTSVEDSSIFNSAYPDVG